MKNRERFWDVDSQHSVTSRIKRYGKMHRDETVSCFNNLSMILDFLNEGVGLQKLAKELKWFRHEQKGIYRIGQTRVNSAKETRLYLYFKEENKTIYILTIGDKDTQRKDIIESCKIVDSIK